MLTIIDYITLIFTTYGFDRQRYGDVEHLS